MPKGQQGFAKGKSGNPKGRPRKQQCIPDILRKIGAEEIDTQNGKMTKIEGLMRMVYKEAVTGNQWAVNFIADRTEGKPAQTMDYTTAGEPISEVRRIIIEAQEE